MEFLLLLTNQNRSLYLHDSYYKYQSLDTLDSHLCRYNHRSPVNKKIRSNLNSLFI